VTSALSPQPTVFRTAVSVALGQEQTHALQQNRGVLSVRASGSISLVEKHPDKTFIGRIERGFDFLGYHFGPTGLAVAKQTLANFIEKASRLYEQEREGGFSRRCA
jgi:hypothetical protein